MPDSKKPSDADKALHKPAQAPSAAPKKAPTEDKAPSNAPKTAKQEEQLLRTDPEFLKEADLSKKEVTEIKKGDDLEVESHFKHDREGGTSDETGLPEKVIEKNNPEAGTFGDNKPAKQEDLLTGAEYRESIADGKAEETERLQTTYTYDGSA
jgi:hypothetical protein